MGAFCSAKNPYGRREHCELIVSWQTSSSANMPGRTVIIVGQIAVEMVGTRNRRRMIYNVRYAYMQRVYVRVNRTFRREFIYAKHKLHDHHGHIC